LWPHSDAVQCACQHSTDCNSSGGGTVPGGRGGQQGGTIIPSHAMIDTHTHTLADGSRPAHLVQCDAHMTCFAHATSRRAAIHECEGKIKGRRVRGRRELRPAPPTSMRSTPSPFDAGVGVHRPHTPHTRVHAQTHSRAAHSRSISIESCARKINTSIGCDRHSHPTSRHTGGAPTVAPTPPPFRHLLAFK